MSIEEGYMLTLARIANLKTLNFSDITSAERTNAEMFYLSRIAKALANVPETEESKVTAHHRRYKELCTLYGEPTIIRTDAATINPDFLEARLIKFTFHLPEGTRADQDVEVTKVQEIPKAFDIYQVKGIVGKLLGLRPLSMRLIWETGEWDPVAGYEDEEEDDSDEEEELLGAATSISENGDREATGKWMKREVELEDCTRQVGFCVDGMEARVRVEMR